MQSIQLQIGVKSSLEQAFQAVATPSGVSGWFTTAQGLIEKGSRFELVFGGGSTELEIIDLEPLKKVSWKVIRGAEDWMGTEIRLELEPLDNQILISFEHLGWKGIPDDMGLYGMKWATYLMSLKQLLDTGTGQPYPTSIPINHY